MYKKDFDALLQKETPKGALFWGDGVVIDIYEKIYIDKIKSLGASVVSFYFDEIDLDQITSLLESSSLFNQIELIHIKTEDRFSKADLAPIIEALKISQSYLLISFYPNKSRSYISHAKAMAASFTRPLSEVRFFEPSHKECLAFLSKRASELELDITNAALDEILSLQRNDLGLALKELEKFCLLDSKIDIKDVQSLSNSTSSLSLDEFISCIFDTRECVFHSYQALCIQGVDDMTIAFRVEQYFYTLFLFYADAKISGAQDCMKILGYNPPRHILDLYLSRSLGLNQDKFEHIFFLLCSMRTDMLNGDKNALLSTIINIKNLL